MPAALESWSTNAINLPDHADNIIHTDAGARAAGFERALVAGTTIYAYLTHVPVAARGLDWLKGGGGELRLQRPVFDNDPVDIVVGGADDAPSLTAEVAGDGRATLDLWEQVEAPALRDGEALRPIEVVIDEAQADYGIRCGDDLGIYAEHNIAHPVTWANLANSMFIENLVTGPWIHVRSKIYHEGLAPVGSTVRVEANLLERFESRAGERALVDMRMYADGAPVATIEHEAIIVLPNS
jgi:acyl dehydratase